MFQRIVRIGCFGVIGAVVLGSLCLATFYAAGALDLEAVPRLDVAPPPRPTPTHAPAATPTRPAGPPTAAVAGATGSATPTGAAGAATATAAATPAATPTTRPATTAVPTPPPVPSPAAGPRASGDIAASLNQTVGASGVNLTALSAARKDDPNSDLAAIVLWVRLKNVGRDTAPSDPALFALVDNRDAKVTSRATSQPNDLPKVTLARGDETEGNLIFFVPRSARGLTLVYDAPGIGQLKIPLPTEF